MWKYPLCCQPAYNGEPVAHKLLAVDVDVNRGLLARRVPVHRDTLSCDVMQ